MFTRGCLFSGARRTPGGLSCLFAGVGVVGVFKALKSPRRALLLLVLWLMLYRDKPQVSSTIGNVSTMMDLCSLNVSLVAGSSSGVVLGGVCRAFVVSGAVSVLRVW